MKRLSISSAVLVFFSLYAGTSFCKDTGLNGFSIQRFNPQTSGYGIYNVEASKVLPHLKFTAGFFADFSNDSASIFMPARNASLKAVNDNLETDFYGALGIANFMEASILLPVVPYQTGSNFGDLSAYTAPAMGDLRFDLKFRVIKDKLGSVGVALLSRVTVPTGSRSSFNGNNGPTWEGRLIVDKEFEPVSLFANVGYRFVKSTRVLSTTYDDSMTFSGGVVVPLPLQEGSWLAKAEVAGETVANNMSKNLTPVEVRGGIRKVFKSGVALDIGAGRGITSAIGSPAFRVFGGLSFSSAPDIKKRAAREVAVEIAAVDYNVPFGFDRSQINSRDIPGLLDLARVLIEQDTQIVIEGHTDSVGGNEYNMNLGLMRANAVKRILVLAGAPAGQIKTMSSGEDRPISSNSTPEGQRQNRRAEIHAAPLP